MANVWRLKSAPVLWFFSDAGVGVALRYALQDLGVEIICPESSVYTVLPTHSALMLTEPGRRLTNWKRVMFERFSTSLELNASLPLTEQLDIVMEFLNREGPPPFVEAHGVEQLAAVM